jgi:hypothetical protein
MLSAKSWSARVIGAASPRRVVLDRPALASQGPGAGAGTAGQFTQLAMAVLVYGTSALVVGAGLIGALRRR